MSFNDWLKKERVIWHKRFIPSLIAGLAVAIISFFFQLTTSNLVMFASLGASAAILTHKHIHRLTILRTVIFSYSIALITGILVVILDNFISLDFSTIALISVSLSTLVMYLANVFHPPAVAASLSFVMVGGNYIEMLMIFVSVTILLILVKLLTYVFYYENLEMKKFMREFKRFKNRLRDK